MHNLLDGRPQATERVQSFVRPIVNEILNQVGTRGVVAMAVVGSASRGEETWCDNKLTSDIDLVAVIRAPDPLLQRRFMIAASQQDHTISLGCCPFYSLGRYRTLEFFEAKFAGWIVYGQHNVFDNVRIYSGQDIPTWEAVRLLLNRAVDLLKVRAGLIPAWYGAVKTYLSLCEADLIIAGCDVPTYRGRWQQIERRRSVFGSTELLGKAYWAINLKLGLDDNKGYVAADEYEQWMLHGLAVLIHQQLGRKVSLLQGLDLLDGQNTHLAHRLVFFSHHLRDPHVWLRTLQHDPIFAIWRNTIEILQGNLQLSHGELQAMLNDFDRVMQPLPR